MHHLQQLWRCSLKMALSEWFRWLELREQRFRNKNVDVMWFWPFFVFAGANGHSVASVFERSAKVCFVEALVCVCRVRVSSRRHFERFARVWPEIRSVRRSVDQEMEKVLPQDGKRTHHVQGWAKERRKKQNPDLCFERRIVFEFSCELESRMACEQKCGNSAVEQSEFSICLLWCFFFFFFVCSSRYKALLQPTYYSDLLKEHAGKTTTVTEEIERDLRRWNEEKRGK